jgi:hypothetical protein
MPTPYAKLQVSVNGGANTFGGVDVPSGATLQFTGESIVSWRQQRWAFADYPEGWAVPSGWTQRSDGLIYSLDVVPPLVTLPDAATLWGVWMPDLRVNTQVDDDINLIDGLYDRSTALSMLSPSGLRDMGALEELQFTSAMTRHKKWLRSWQQNLRALENPKISSTSSDDTPSLIRRYPVPDGGVRVIRAVVKVQDATGAIYGEYEVKGAWNRLAGTLAELYPPVITPVVESDANLGVTLTLDGDDAVLLNGVGLVATPLVWAAQEAFF